MARGRTMPSRAKKKSSRNQKPKKASALPAPKKKAGAKRKTPTAKSRAVKPAPGPPPEPTPEKPIKAKTAGRPTLYTKELGLKICENLVKHNTLRKVAALDGMPSKATICRWLFDEDKKDFQDQYTRARKIQEEFIFDDTIDIADDGSRDYKDVPGNIPTYIVNKEHIARSRVRIDTRKYFLAKLNPSRFAERFKHDHTGVEGLAENLKKKREQAKRERERRPKAAGRTPRRRG